MMRRRKRHFPEQIVVELRDTDVMLNARKDLATELQSCMPGTNYVSQTKLTKPVE